MHTHESSSAAEKILWQRWQELVDLQQHTEEDECRLAETVRLPQPGALKLVEGMSLTELSDFVPSPDGIVGQFEQALHQMAVVSFRWAVHNLMIAAQVTDAGLRDTHRQLSNWYAECAVNLSRELLRFRESARPRKRMADGSSAGAAGPSTPASPAADVSA